MKVLKPALILLIVIIFAAANLNAEQPRLGKLAFENGQIGLAISQYDVYDLLCPLYPLY